MCKTGEICPTEDSRATFSIRVRPKRVTRDLTTCTGGGTEKQYTWRIEIQGDPGTKSRGLTYNLVFIVIES